MPRALVLSPVRPRRQGRGLEQRAFRLIEALAHSHRVSLLTTEPDEVTADAGDLAGCAEVWRVPRGRWTPVRVAARLLRGVRPQPSDWVAPTRREGAAVRALAGASRFDVVLVHRLYMWPWVSVLPSLRGTPVCLDLDDVESETRGRVAALARSNGDRRVAAVLARDASAYAAIESRACASVARVFLCHEADRARVPRDPSGRRVHVLPNVVDVPAAPRPAPGGADPFVFLFVGALHYYPNRDAIAFWCRDVVPRLRACAPGPFRVRIVARGARTGLPSLPEVSWADDPVDLADEYARAGAAIVPIRAGGGTRIKALEAFAHQTPVVSTTLGVEGLAVTTGQDVLVGDSADALAAHAATLMRRPEVGQALAARAWSLVQRAYTPAVLRARLTAALADLPEAQP